MTGPGTLDILDAEARGAAHDEEEFRRSYRDTLEALERRRVHGFRRLNFIRAMIDATHGAKDFDEAADKAFDAACLALDWTEESAARKPVLDKLSDIADAIGREAFPVKTASTNPPAPAPTTRAVIEALETWHEATYGKAFWTLFDVYRPETPVVDF